MSSVAPALAPTNIISIILNSSQHQAVTLPKQIARTCASCCVQQAQPFRVLGRNVPAQPSGSAQRPSPGTASTPLLGSVPRTPGGTAASGTRPGLLLGCGPSRPASRHPVRVIFWASIAKTRDNPLICRKQSFTNRYETKNHTVHLLYINHNRGYLQLRLFVLHFWSKSAHC